MYPSGTDWRRKQVDTRRGPGSQESIRRWTKKDWLSTGRSGRANNSPLKENMNTTARKTG